MVIVIPLDSDAVFESLVPAFGLVQIGHKNGAEGGKKFDFPFRKDIAKKTFACYFVTGYGRVLDADAGILGGF
jgi:hypothetical protein